MRRVSRFAPTPSGRAHPGTLLAALLAWLDARQRGAEFIVRLEDLDRERCSPAYAEALLEDLRWFGLDWDRVERQQEHGAAHAAALDALAAQGRLYPSSLSRRELAQGGRRAPDGGWWYDNRERGRPLPPGGWRACREPIRCRLDDGCIALRDESGLDLSQDPAAACGDPIVRRRDGIVSYALAVVVDDARSGVDRVVRGRDIAPGTATQVALQRLLGLPTPVYRHHLLVMEAEGGKLSKSHGAIGGAALRAVAPERLCGYLAFLAGLAPRGARCRPRELLASFAWQQVATRDAVFSLAELLSAAGDG
ncbi:MAG: glutamate--tRNA ligase family protein [Planctomycetota bacterium]|nr:glutamate--tRNA ligase family protein [Planctomycetota bacterium]